MSADRKHEHFDTAVSQIGHLTNLLNDVLSINQTESVGFEFRPAPLDMEAFCRQVVEQMQQNAPTHRLEFHAGGDYPEVLADEKLLQQILTNLISNAIRYSRHQCCFGASLAFLDSEAVLQVKDEGIGIPYLDQEHLFEMFHRASNVGAIQGSGLGLAIVKRAVEAHGGTITFESAEGVGTTFTVTLSLLHMGKAAL